MGKHTNECHIDRTGKRVYISDVRLGIECARPPRFSKRILSISTAAMPVTAPRSNLLTRLLPSLTDLAFLLPIALVYGKLEGARTMLADAGTGWHVRSGEWILAHGRVPHSDVFSFTKPGAPWFAWEWLCDVAFGWLHLHWGMAAVVLASVLALSLTSALLYRLVERACENVLVAFGVTALAMMASSIHWLARPHVFTLLLTAIFLHILERARAGRARLLLCLPPLMALWTNLHGGFLAGLILAATYAAAPLAKGLISCDDAGRRAEFRRAIPYLAALAASAAATFMNPYFYRLHAHILQFLNEPFHFLNISEFQSLSFQHPAARYFEVLLILAVCATVWSLRRGQWTYALLAASWIHPALTSSRNIPIFAIVAAAPIGKMVAECLAAASAARIAKWLRALADFVWSAGSEFRPLETLPRWHATAAAGFLALAMASFAPDASAKFKAEFDPARFPVKAVDHMGNRLGRTFSNDQWGSYLIYRLYPNGGRVFMDDRSDFYGPAFDEAWLAVLKGRYDWSAYLDRYAVDTVLLPPDAPLVSTLKESHLWRVVYDDGVVIVFRAARDADSEGSQDEARGGKDLAIARSRIGS